MNVVKQGLHLMLLGLAVAVALPGCTSQSVVPTGSTLVGSGTGNQTYQTPTAGSLYIYDQTWNQLVYAGWVDAGQIVTIKPLDGQVLIDGGLAVQKPLGAADTFRIYLDPSTAGRAGTGMKKEPAAQE